MGLAHIWKYISKSRKGLQCPPGLTSSMAQDREGHRAIPSKFSLCEIIASLFGLAGCWCDQQSEITAYLWKNMREVQVIHFHPNQICTRQLISHSMMQTRANADKPTGDCVADSDKDPLKICKITPGGLEHVHETVDIKILHPKNKTKQNKSLEKIISSFLNTLPHSFPPFYIPTQNKFFSGGMWDWSSYRLKFAGCTFTHKLERHLKGPVPAIAFTELHSRVALSSLQWQCVKTYVI